MNSDGGLLSGRERGSERNKIKKREGKAREYRKRKKEVTMVRGKRVGAREEEEEGADYRRFCAHE